MISIIIPVYNVEKYLEKCILSMLDLKTDYEIILVDDGSTDRSGELCDEWAKKEKRIKVIHQKNSGLSAARNTGIRRASGEYVMFVDSDDFIDSEQTDEMLSNLNPEINILLGLYQNYYTQQDCYEKESCAGFLSMDGMTPINQFLKAIPRDGQSCFMIACRFIVRTEFLIKNDLFFVSGIYHEDEEWTMRLLCRADAVYVSHNYFYQYRQEREGSITGGVKPKHITDRFLILHRAEKLLQKQEMNLEKTEYVKCRMAQLYLSNMIDSYLLNKESKKEAYQELKYFRNQCSKKMSGIVGSFAKIVDFIFGIRFTCFLLHLAKKIKK